MRCCESMPPVRHILERMYGPRRVSAATLQMARRLVGFQAVPSHASAHLRPDKLTVERLHVVHLVNLQLCDTSR